MGMIRNPNCDLDHNRLKQTEDSQTSDSYMVKTIKADISVNCLSFKPSGVKWLYFNPLLTQTFKYLTFGYTGAQY